MTTAAANRLKSDAPIEEQSAPARRAEQRETGSTREQQIVVFRQDAEPEQQSEQQIAADARPIEPAQQRVKARRRHRDDDHRVAQVPLCLPGDLPDQQQRQGRQHRAPRIRAKAAGGQKAEQIGQEQQRVLENTQRRQVQAKHAERGGLQPDIKRRLIGIAGQPPLREDDQLALIRFQRGRAGGADDRVQGEIEQQAEDEPMLQRRERRRQRPCRARLPEPCPREIAGVLPINRQ